MRPFSSFRLGAAALTALLAAATLATPVTPARAQATATTGAIRGRVTGAQGQPLAGAVVTATNEQTGFARSASADDEGAYTVRFLPVGTYRVGARRIGSTPAEVPGVRVIVGSTASANITLQEAAVQLQQVQVTAQAQAVDVTEKGVRTTVTQEQIENLPTLGRDFTDFINLSPLVSPTPEATTGGQFAIAGQRPSQTNVQIDGVDANNSFFGENRGGSRIPFNFSMESIREFQIITNGYDVEYGNYSGGVVNILTRSGTNNFRLNAYGNYRGDQLTARDFNNQDPRDFTAQQYALSVSGPIRKDKAFYLFSFDGQRRREPFQPTDPDVIRAQSKATLERLGPPVANEDTAIRNARTRATNQGLYADALDRFIGILDTTYGIKDARAGYRRFNTSNDVAVVFGRLDFNLGERHRLSVRNNYSNHNNDNETFGAVQFGGLSKAESFKNRTNSLVAELNTSFGEDRFNVFRIQHSHEGRPRLAKNRLPELRVDNLGVPGFTDDPLYAGASVSFNNNLDENKLQIVDNFSFGAGNHSFKLGTNNLFSSYRNLFWNQGSGFFTFNTLDDLKAMTPARYTRTLRIDGQPPRADFDAQEYSFYGQDDWQVTPKLLASLGLRYDIARYGDRPGRVIDVERAFGFTTGTAPIDDNNVSPRVALAYDLKGDATSVVRVGGGLFYGRVPFVLGSNVAITDVPLVSLDCAGSIAENAPDRPPSVAGYGTWPQDASMNPTNCGGAGGIGGTPTYTFWANDFEIPETWKANVGYEHQLFANTRLKLDFTHTASNKLYTVRNLNLRDPQFTIASEGGRNVYVPVGRFNPSASAGVDRFRFTDFGDIYVNYNDGIARSQAYSVELDHRFGQATTVNVSYAYTRAGDNSSYNCCTAFEGFSAPRVGLFSPNVLGGVKDENRGWGASNFVRPHTLVVSGFTALPWKLRLSTIWRVQSGTPFSPEQGGDLNGDGQSFNDRPFIFHPDSLPVFVAATAPDTQRTRIVNDQRALYRGHLNRYECVREHIGRIIPRNVCNQPVFNRVDMSVRRRFDVPTMEGARGFELQVDLFNVLNGINSDWGRYTAITAANRNIYSPRAYNSTTGKIEYEVQQNFGRETALGTNLLLQFSAQVGLRAYF